MFDVAVDKHDRIFVTIGDAYSGLSRDVWVLSADGDVVFSVSSLLSSSTFRPLSPDGLCLNDDDDVMICDSRKRFVLFYDNDCGIIKTHCQHTTPATSCSSLWQRYDNVS